ERPDEAEDRDEQEPRQDEQLDAEEQVAEEVPDQVAETVGDPQDDERGEGSDGQHQTLLRMPEHELAPSGRERDERQGAHVGEDQQEPVLVSQLLLQPRRIVVHAGSRYTPRPPASTLPTWQEDCGFPPWEEKLWLLQPIGWTEALLGECAAAYQ